MHNQCSQCEHMMESGHAEPTACANCGIRFRPGSRVPVFPRPTVIRMLPAAPEVVGPVARVDWAPQSHVPSPLVQPVLGNEVVEQPAVPPKDDRSRANIERRLLDYDHAPELKRDVRRRSWTHIWVGLVTTVYGALLCAFWALVFYVLISSTFPYLAVGPLVVGLFGVLLVVTGVLLFRAGLNDRLRTRSLRTLTLTTLSLLVAKAVMVGLTAASLIWIGGRARQNPKPDKYTEGFAIVSVTAGNALVGSVVVPSLLCAFFLGLAAARKEVQSPEAIDYDDRLERPAMEPRP
jgi:hypothetical protein